MLRPLRPRRRWRQLQRRFRQIAAPGDNAQGSGTGSGRANATASVTDAVTDATTAVGQETAAHEEAIAPKARLLSARVLVKAKRPLTTSARHARKPIGRNDPTELSAAIETLDALPFQ